MGKIKTDLIATDLMVETKNALGKKIKVYVGPTVKNSHAWEEKGKTRNCEECNKYIDRLTAIDIIEIVGEQQNNGWIHPLEGRILGICTFGLWPKVLVPPRMTNTESLKICRYLNGHD